MKYLALLSCIFVSFAAHASIGSEALHIGQVITHFLEAGIKPMVAFLAFLILGAPYEIFGETRTISAFGIPLIVLWLIIGGIFFTIKLRFINLRLFAHAIEVVRGKYTKESENAPGKVTHAQALFTAISATVGLGNIAGVAIAVSIGGPGAVIWMMIAAFFGMSTKFAEVTLGLKYRQFDKEGHLQSGAFYYLENGLAGKGLVRTGKVLGVIAAIFCVFGAIGAGIIFQANQSIAIVSHSFNLSHSGELALVTLLAASVGAILVGGVHRIALTAEKVVPLMATIYILSCIVILFVNAPEIPKAIAIMFSSAFAGDAVYGGVIGAIIQGIKRSAFSNEAGIGSAPIAHAAAKTTEPVREGSVAILEPFIDTIIVCFMTGIVITVTGVYHDTSVHDGIIITKNAFETVSPWFPYILSVAVFLFAFSTILTYSYYGKQAWVYLTNTKNHMLCYGVFTVAVFIGGMINLGVAIDLADILFLSMAIPNLIGLYILSGEIKADADTYVTKLKSGGFVKNKKVRKARKAK